MAKTGAFWDSYPKDFIGVVDASVYELTNKRAKSIFNNCITLSPVDTGAYRASWTISEGAPVFQYAGRQSAGTTLPQPNFVTTLPSKFYRKFFVANGAPYAQRLEDGWSGQAPLGVLRQAIRMTGK